MIACASVTLPTLATATFTIKKQLETSPRLEEGFQNQQQVILNSNVVNIKECILSNDDCTYFRSPRLVLLRALNRLSLQYSSNYIRGEEIRRLGIGKKSAETKSDGSEMAKTPDDGLSTVQKWQNLWLDAEIECRKLKECVKTLKLTTFLSYLTPYVSKSRCLLIYI